MVHDTFHTVNPSFALGTREAGVLDFRVERRGALVENWGYNRACMIDGVMCPERVLQFPRADSRFIGNFDTMSQGSVQIRKDVSTIGSM